MLKPNRHATTGVIATTTITGTGMIAATQFGCHRDCASYSAHPKRVGSTKQSFTINHPALHTRIEQRGPIGELGKHWMHKTALWCHWY